MFLSLLIVYTNDNYRPSDVNIAIQFCLSLTRKYEVSEVILYVSRQD